MCRLINIYLVYLLNAIFKAGLYADQDGVWLPNVQCGAHLTLVKTDPHHHYYPAVVKLLRCNGDPGGARLSCTPSEVR